MHIHILLLGFLEMVLVVYSTRHRHVHMLLLFLKSSCSVGIFAFSGFEFSDFFFGTSSSETLPDTSIVAFFFLNETLTYQLLLTSLVYSLSELCLQLLFEVILILVLI